MIKGDDGNNYLEIDVPLKSGSEGYLQVMLMNYSQIGNIIANIKGISDPRLYLHTQLMINMITDEKKRYELMGKFRELQAKYRNEDGITQENQEVCLMVIGEVTSWMDEFLGITTKNLIGVK